MPADADRLDEGALVAGRYRIERELGRGGMSRVYLARDETLRRQVALKIVEDDASDASAVDRARSEALVAASLDDARLVTVHDAFSEQVGDGRRTVIVMRFVEGTDLSDLLARGPLAPSRAAALGADIASALATVHAAGIVHRDVKPANIRVAGTPERAVLVDFGIARAADTPPLTVTGTVIGTPAYLSPEQVLGREVSSASDVYALGLVLLEALTGRREFEGPDVEAAIARVSRDPIVPPSLGPEWSALLADMTRRDPAHRPDAHTVRNRLLGIESDPAAIVDAPTAAMPAPTRVMPAGVAARLDAGAATGATEPLEPGVASVVPSRRRRLPLVVGGAIVVAAVAVVVALAVPHPGDAARTPAVAPTSTIASTATSAPVVSTQSTPTPVPTVSSVPAPPHPGPGKPAHPGHGKGHSKR